MEKAKKKLSFEQEFQILLLVMDKFLWLGFGIMAVGLYYIIVSTTNTMAKGLVFLAIGAGLLGLLMLLLIREYEIFEAGKKR